jgi:hypothetical protein
MKNPFRVGCAALVATVFVLAGQVKADATSLHANDYLFQGQQLAMSCYYSLRMQSDGNLVLYDWRNHAYWASNTVGRGAYAVMQQDGNFVVYDWTGVPVWDAATMNSRFAYLVLQSDRNLVIYDGYGSARWASNTVNFSSVGTVTAEAMRSKRHDMLAVSANRPFVRSYRCRTLFVACIRVFAGRSTARKTEGTAGR